MKIKKIFFVLVLLFSCKKPEVEILISNEDNIQLEKRIDMSLINNSINDYTLLLNNSDTLTVSEDYSIYYKIFDEDFKEIKKVDISILDGVYLISDNFQFLYQKKQDSIKYYKEFAIGRKDTITYSFYLKKRFYYTPLSYQYYEIDSDKIYYIRFFVQNLRKSTGQKNENQPTKILQSRYYQLK